MIRILNDKYLLLDAYYSSEEAYEDDPLDMQVCLEIDWFINWLNEMDWESAEHFLNEYIQDDVDDIEVVAEQANALAFCYVPGLQKYIFPANADREQMEALRDFMGMMPMGQVIQNRLGKDGPLPHGPKFSSDAAFGICTNEPKTGIRGVQHLLEALGVTSEVKALDDEGKFHYFVTKPECEYTDFELGLLSRLPEVPDSFGLGQGNDIFHDGNLILCKTEEMANFLADVWDNQLDSGSCATTGYFDPAEDKESGETDKLTGFYYIDI